MSSFKKAIKARRKTHKERQQPGHRVKYGLLEKGKDWKRRRDDYHFKEKRIKSMVEKIRNKNSDEFYFGMLRSKSKEGVHIAERKNEGYTASEMKLLRTQDVGYINLRAQQEREKIEKLKASMHVLLDAEEDDNEDIDSTDGFMGDTGISDSTKNNHIIFVGSKKRVKTFDPVKHFDTAPELVSRKFNRPRIETLKNQEVKSVNGQTRKKLAAQQQAGFEELAQRIDRLESLEKIAAKMQLEKQLLGKGRKVKVKGGDGKPTMYKWKRERKR